MAQSCQLHFPLFEESIPRIQTHFFSFAKTETLKRKNFEADDDRLSSVSRPFLILWLLCLLLAFFFKFLEGSDLIYERDIVIEVKKR